MNIGGIGRGSTTTPEGQPDLLKDATSAAQKLTRQSTANNIGKIQSVKVKVKVKAK